MFSTLITGLALLLFEPDMHSFGGMSGIVCTSILYLCLMECDEPGPGRFLYLGAIAATLLKISFELSSREPVFASQGLFPFEVVPLAHAIGALTALGAYLWCQKRMRIEEYTLSEKPG